MTQTQLQKNPRTTFVSKENEIYRIIKEQRKNKSHVRILFTSIWDNEQNAICAELRDSVLERTDSVDLYVVDSFSCPHAFVIFRIGRTPTLVTLNEEKVTVEDYVPMIYSELGI